MLDALISIVFLVPAVIVFIVGPTKRGTCTDFNGFETSCTVPTGATIGLGVVFYIAGFVAYAVIYVRMLGKGATWGRKAVGYRILDSRSMQPIGTGRAVGRYFATILSAMPCYLGFLWPLWDSENRTFHDMIVNTRAVMD